MEKIYLVDAMAMIFRSYYALGKNFLTNSKGQNVTAVQKFLEILLALIEKEKPNKLVVVFDTKAKTFRSEEFDFYKANREETPEDIIWSIPIIKEIIDAMGISRIELDRFEADDIIGTIAKQEASSNTEVYMVTPDKDYGQLVEENIYMYKPGMRGKKEEILGVSEICEKWEINHPLQLIDILGLMGDAVDNIPGIKGVGEKTAIKLLKEHGSIETLLENTNQVKGKMREKIELGKEDAIISKQLATIKIDVPVSYEVNDWGIGNPNKEILEPIFNDLEFRSLGKRVFGDGFTVGGGQLASNSPGTMDMFAEQEANSTIQKFGDWEVKYELITQVEDARKLVKKLSEVQLFCFDTETTGLDPMTASMIGLSFCAEEGLAYYIALPLDNKELRDSIIQEVKPLFANQNIHKLAHNLKYDLIILERAGIPVTGPYDDSLIAHFLVEPEMRHGMDFLAETYLNYSPVSITDLIGKKGKGQGTMDQVELSKVSDYACEDADITFRLHHVFAGLLEREGLTELYRTVEIPLVQVLARMEMRGVKVDSDFLSEYSKELAEEILSKRDIIYQEAGMEFNVDSPKQMGDVLFNHMGITYKGKKTKTGQYSTNEETLKALEGDHPIIDAILEYREMTKLKSTYVDSLPNLIHPETGRIHTTYSQTVAVTGRLSSNNPNLQNIPIRSERGKKIRAAFIPEGKGVKLMAADYSQIELRIMASIAKDEAMISAFKEGLDIHTATAAKVNKVDTKAVDSDMRRKAKMVNFGIIYGISAHGLSQRLGIDRKEAKSIIDSYFETYPGVNAFMKEIVQEAKDKGYVETILGRKRKLSDINSKNFTVRGFAERNAINSPIQGSAADIIKVAMIELEQKIQERGFKSSMLLQVHDELVFEVHEDEQAEFEQLVIETMMSASQLEVPMEVEAGYGENWLEAH